MNSPRVLQLIDQQSEEDRGCGNSGSYLRTKRKNQDVFAWSHKDMVGIEPNISCHHLNIDSHFSPIQQKRRLLDKKISRALKEEVEKLRENRFIQEAYYPSWVDDHVLVPKPNEKWRTYVDFTDLNKACPNKD